MLIHIVSLTLQLTTSIYIVNQCFDIELVSPVYFAKDAMSYIHLHQQVDANYIMKVKFRAGIDRSAFGGALLYHLQRKKGASISTQFLTIWGYKSDNLYLRAWLIEHESILDWDKDRLKKLYDIYSSQLDRDFTIEGWLLDDNTKLKTKCRIAYNDFRMEVTISEEKNLNWPIKPLWIDPNR
jgi:hypothetical protein